MPPFDPSSATLFQPEAAEEPTAGGFDARSAKPWQPPAAAAPPSFGGQPARPLRHPTSQADYDSMPDKSADMRDVPPYQPRKNAQPAAPASSSEQPYDPVAYAREVLGNRAGQLRRVWNAGRGAYERAPDLLTPEAEGWLREHGQGLTASTLQGAGRTFIRGPAALFTAAQQLVVESLEPMVGPQLARDIAAFPEAFMGSPGIQHEAAVAARGLRDRIQSSGRFADTMGEYQRRGPGDNAYAGQQQRQQYEAEAAARESYMAGTQPPGTGQRRLAGPRAAQAPIPPEQAASSTPMLDEVTRRAQTMGPPPVDPALVATGELEPSGSPPTMPGALGVQPSMPLTGAGPRPPGPRVDVPAGVNPYAGHAHADALWAAERSIVGPESGGVATAQNGRSSAGGLFQIIDSTWDHAMAQLGLPIAATTAERNAQKYRPDLNTMVMRQINTDAAQHLDANGIPVTPELLQAAHRLGPGGAADAYRAATVNPTAPLVGNGLSPSAAHVNPDIAGKTVGDFLARPYPGHGGGGAGLPAAPLPGQTEPAPQAAPQVPPPPPQPAADLLGDVPERIAGGYAMVDPRSLTIDPERFQFKASGEHGVTGALQGMSRWEPSLANPITAWEGEDGRMYVVNGHQRTDLALRAQQAGQEDVMMAARVFRAQDGYTPEYMRALGAYQNIAEGSGTAIDAARVMRSINSLPAEMRLPDLPPRSALVQYANGLVNLSDAAFGTVANGMVPPEFAAQVGTLIKDPREQMAALDVLARANPANIEQARLMVRDIQNSGFLQGSQTTLFGDEAFAQSLVPERARVLNTAMQALRRNKNVFRAAVEGEESLTQAGNKLDTAANQKARTDNAQLLETIERDAVTKGPLSDALSDAARDVAGGKPANGAAARFLTAARRIVGSGQATGSTASAPVGRDGSAPSLASGLSEEAVPLYSAVTRAAEGLRQARGTGEQMLSQITKTPGVKPEEIKWLGLDDWLKGQRSVTKDQIADYLRANSLDVREVVRGSTDAEKAQVKREVEALGIDWPRASIQSIENSGGSADLASRFSKYIIGEPDTPPTKYGSYTLSGGENYREMLITLPPKPRGYEAINQRLIDKYGGLTEAWGKWTPEEAAEFNRVHNYETLVDHLREFAKQGTNLALFDRPDGIENFRRFDHNMAETLKGFTDDEIRQAATEAGQPEPQTYKSAHWDERNVLAHIRFNERIAPDGARVLFVEEAQSDWHQQGRRQGYSPSPERLKELVAQRDALADDDPRREPIQQQLDQFSDGRQVPDAPYKTTWPALTMRRIIKWAVDNGFDRVAWAPGEVHTDRYDLSKQISRITLHDNSSGGIGRPTMEGPFERGHLEAYDHRGRTVISHGIQDAKELPDLIGKEAADKLLSVTPTAERYAGLGIRQRELSGLDLKIGGEGMKGFYDKILPAETNKIIGKFGAKVAPTEVTVGHTDRETIKPDAQATEKYDAQWNDVTKEIRRMEDLPAAPTREAEAARQQLLRRMYTMLDGIHEKMIDETMARGRPQAAHGFDITPQMRDAVGSDGMALFQPPDLFGNDVPQRGQKRAAEPTIRNDQRQVDLFGPGSAAQAQAARDAQGRGALMPTREQAPANEGLFARPEPVQPSLLSQKPTRSLFSEPGTRDMMATVPHAGEPHAESRTWVLEHGGRTGHEYLTAVDRNGDQIVHATTSDKPAAAAFQPREVRGMAPDSLIIHHNHPSNSALSRGDIVMAFTPQIHSIVAHTASGDVFTARAKGGFAMRNANWTDLELGTVMQQVRGIADVAARKVNDLLKPLVNDGRVSMEGANHAYWDMVSRTLHATGIIDYTSTRPVPASLAEPFRRMIDGLQLSADITDRHALTIRPDEAIARLREGNGATRQPAPGSPGGAPGSARVSGGEGSGQQSPRRPVNPIQGRLLEDPVDFSRNFYTGALFDPEAWAWAVGPLRRPIMGVTHYMHEVGQSIANGLAPIRNGTVRSKAFAADFANNLRKVQYHFMLIDKEIERTFNPAQRDQMGRALDAQSVFEQQVSTMPAGDQAAARAAFDAGGTGVASLNPGQRHTVEMLNQLSQATWAQMRQRGMVDPHAEGLPYYFPRQMIRWSEENGFTKTSGAGGSGHAMHPQGGNLNTQGPMHREHLTPEQTEAAAQAVLGRDAQLIRDIRSLPNRLAFAHKAMVGVDLINRIDQVARDVGAGPTVIRGMIPGLLDPSQYRTMADHPSFRHWTGSGFVPIYIPEEFYGPLTAVLTKPSPTWYRAAQGLKGGYMSLIMWSPFIHLQVELGRSFPVMPSRFLPTLAPKGSKAIGLPIPGAGHTLTLRILRDGGVSRGDLGFMDKAIENGLAPLGQGWGKDLVSIADETRDPNLNRGPFLRALAGARDAMANGARHLGGEFLHDMIQHPHQTLLWDQVFNLQVGIYKNLLAKWSRTFPEDVAATMAAHIANRYAGALPQEHLSKGANMAANLILFSRSFTLGNLGVMKDMFTGAPPHILARIERMADEGTKDRARWTLRRKAISAFIMDIGLFYMGNALLQAGIQAMRQGIDSMGSDWMSKATDVLEELRHTMNPLDVFHFLPQHWNEPGKQDRVFAGLDRDGRGIYVRLPFGKIGEEFVGWFLKPGTMTENKLNPPVRALVETIIGHDTLDRALYREHPQGAWDHMAIAGQAVKHIVESLGPTSTIQGAWELYQEHVRGKPQAGDRGVALAKVLGPATGLAQISSGFPGGPAAGEIANLRKNTKFDLQQALPDIRRKFLTSGDQEGAIKALQDQKVDPGLIRFYLRSWSNPGMMTRGMAKSLHNAPPEVRSRVEHEARP